MNNWNSITPVQERDSCLALAFLILLVWLFYRSPYLVYAGMAVLLYGMIWPAGMKPFAYIWFGLSRLLSKVVGSCILGIIWLCLVVPMGLSRRAMGKDSMQLKKWHNGNDSVFVNRNHKFTAKDINTPY